MTADSPKPRQSRPGHAAMRYMPGELRPFNAHNLVGSAICAAVCGALVALIGLIELSEAIWGNTPPDPEWGLWKPVLISLAGLGVMAGGIGLWRRRKWALGLLVGVLCASIGAAGGGILAMQMVLVLVWLFFLVPLIADPLRRIEPEIDEIAESLGIDWSSTMLARINELLAQRQKSEATRLYREHFACSWDDALLGITMWETERIPNKLRHIAHVVKCSISESRVL